MSLHNFSEEFFYQYQTKYKKQNALFTQNKINLNILVSKKLEN